jgi:hypothetical protein
MSKRLYLDGCSYTYGLGLDSKHTLGHLFQYQGEYIVTNKSRPGKSNLAIAIDAYSNFKNYDTIVLGFTYASRFYLKSHNHDIDFLISRKEIDIVDSANGEQLEMTYKEFHKYFFTLFESPFDNNLSDMIIDSIISHMGAQGKKVVCFSWEQRDTTNKILYPFISANMRLADSHLNKTGTKYLYDMLQREINE